MTYLHGFLYESKGLTLVLLSCQYLVSALLSNLRLLWAVVQVFCGGAQQSQQPLILSEQVILRAPPWINQIVALESRVSMVRLDVCLTVGGPALPAGFHSLALSPSAAITRHIPWISIATFRAALPELVNDLREGSVKAQIRPSSLKHLSAQRAVGGVALNPAFTNTPNTEPVPTRNWDRVGQYIQAYWTGELVSRELTTWRKGQIIINTQLSYWLQYSTYT